MRLYQLATPTATTRLAYDGVDRIAEYDGSNNLLRRYVHGPGDDEVIVWYEGSGTIQRRFISSDERGSIVSLTDSSGALIAINRYDEYGIPQSAFVGGVFSHATGRMAIALRGVPGRMGKAARNARAGALGDAAGNVVSDATAGVYCGKSN
jgi:hypothetical protein